MVSVISPLVPVIVIVDAPAVAVKPAVSVSVVDDGVEAGLKTAVTPLGRPLAVKATLPENPPASFTLMVELALVP